MLPPTPRTSRGDRPGRCGRSQEISSARRRFWSRATSATMSVLVWSSCCSAAASLATAEALACCCWASWATIVFCCASRRLSVFVRRARSAATFSSWCERSTAWWLTSDTNCERSNRSANDVAPRITSRLLPGPAMYSLAAISSRRSCSAWYCARTCISSVRVRFSVVSVRSALARACAIFWSTPASCARERGHARLLALDLGHQLVEPGACLGELRGRVARRRLGPGEPGHEREDQWEGPARAAKRRYANGGGT